MITLSINKKACSLPQSWLDCNVKQLKALCNIINARMGNDDTIMYSLRALAGQPFDVLLNIENEYLTEMKKTVGFVNTPPNFIVPIVPSIRKGFTTYRAVQQGLSNCTFEQYFQFVEFFFSAYLHTNDLQHLYLFIAALYPPRKFDAANIEQTAKQLQPLDKQTIAYIVFWFVSCRNYLSENFKHLFSKPEKNKPPIDNLGFIKLLDNLNQGDASRNEALRKTNLYEILQRIQNAIEEYRKLTNINKKR